MAYQTHNFDPIFRGDTIYARTYTVTQNTLPASIESARLYFRTASKKLVFKATCVVAGNEITMNQINDTDTQEFPVGTLYYDLEITLTNGIVRTWVKGIQEILQDQSYE
jgi:hypothetical protein